MRDLRDEDLILYYYGEARDGDEIRRQLEASPAATERYQELCRMLELVDNHPVPEPWDDYDQRVWRRLQPRLAERAASPASAWWSGFRLAPRRLASAAALAILLAVAFTAGRFWPGSHPGGEGSMAVAGSDLVDRDLSQAAGQGARGPERILWVAVGEHLERSKMLLIELANAPSGAAPAALVDELERAEELLPYNRLYRQAARRSGQAAVAELLDDLERLLLEIAHHEDLSAASLSDLRQRIDEDGILFRVQVIGSQAERQRQSRSPSASGDV